MRFIVKIIYSAIASAGKGKGRGKNEHMGRMFRLWKPVASGWDWSRKRHAVGMLIVPVPSEGPHEAGAW